MQLSEAIRLGSMLGPQSFGKYHDPKTHATCAAGAAALALGGEVSFNEVLVRWCYARHLTCPSCGRNDLHLVHLIEHLNDEHRWTREAIADWVEALEAKHDIKVPIFAIRIARELPLSTRAAASSMAPISQG
jgi:hypothetical protein